MEPRERFRPGLGDAETPTLQDVQRAIERLEREDRAMLRPWVLARFDVQGYPERGWQPPDTGGSR